MRKIPEGLVLRHCLRMSVEPRVWRHVKAVNKQFLKEKKTDLEHIEGDYEAVYLEDEESGEIVSVIAFGRVETHKKKDTYYWMPVVHTHPGYRGTGCYAALLDWLKAYARRHGGSSLSTEVRANNAKMVAAQDKSWERDYIRYKFKLRK